MRQIKIFDGTDRAKELGFETFDELIIGFSNMMIEKLMHAGLKIEAAKVKRWNGSSNESASPAIAYINGGRWLGTCPICGSTEYVASIRPILFCHTCHNDDIQQAARPVVFPPEAEKILIELTLLENEMELPNELKQIVNEINSTELARIARPQDGFARLDWRPT